MDQVAREILAIPVPFKRVPLGVAILASVAPFAADVGILVEQFRADLGLALNNALSHDRLQRLAAMGPLTEAYNRRFGLSRLHEEFARAVRSGSPLGVLRLDLDRRDGGGRGRPAHRHHRQHRSCRRHEDRLVRRPCVVACDAPGRGGPHPVGEASPAVMPVADISPVVGIRP